MTRQRRYQRLLRLYPKDYRETYGAELLDTLAATARSPHAESLNLIGGAFVARVRRLRPESAPWRDAVAIASLLAPLLLLAGAGNGLHETALFVLTHGSLREILRTFVTTPLWLAWVVVLILGLFRLRRSAMVGSWIATAAMVVAINRPVAVPAFATGAAGWSLLAILTAIACTTSDGIRHGYELVGRARTILVAVSVLLVLCTRVLGHDYPLAYVVALVIAVGCAGCAVWRDKVVRWRVTALFATPLFAVVSTVWLYHGARGFALPHIVYEYAPPLVVLAIVVITWRIAARRPLTGKAPSA